MKNETKLPGIRALPTVCLFAVVTMLGCGGPPAPSPADLSDVVATEATFGGVGCRRLEEPSRVAELVSFHNQLDDRWQRFWGDPDEPVLSVVFLNGAGEPVGALGVGSGQFFARLPEGPGFRPVAGSEAERFVELTGGAPLGGEDGGCRSRPR